MNRRMFLIDVSTGVGFLFAATAGLLSLALPAFKWPANAQQPHISGAASGAIHISGNKK